MDTKGRHLLVEYYGCQQAILNDVNKVERLLKEAATAAGATIVQSVFHRFTPQGVSGVVVIEESHLSVHTWPETGYAAVDFYTCGDCPPERAHEVLLAGLESRRAEVMFIERGLRGPKSMHVRDHRTDLGPRQTLTPVSDEPPSDHPQEDALAKAFNS